jgi:hypothetical protein
MFVPSGIRKPIEYAEARRMRTLGFSYKVIAATLGISPCSAFNWTNDVELSDEQKWEIIYGPKGPQNPEHVSKRAEAWRAKNQSRRAAYQDEGRRRAQLRDPLHMAGCMLYWAEGAKDRNNVLIANSDLHLIRFFKDFVTQCFDLGDEDFSVRLNVYLDNGIELSGIESHWLDALLLPRSCLRKHTLNHFPTSSSGRKRNRLPYGVCFLRVLRSTWLVQHIYGAIQEYGGFDEPGWLDGPANRQTSTRSSA